MKLTIRKTAAVLLSLLLTAAMLPTCSFAAAEPEKSAAPAVYREGAVLRGGDGQTYQFPKSEQGHIPIWYVDTSTGQEKVFEGQYESGEPKRTYVIQQNGQSFRGYCVEHGVRVDTSKPLTASDRADLIYAGLSAAQQTNLKLALYYGYQSGDTAADLMDQGFSDSRYYGQNGTSYNWADWYISTQCLVWEIQQKNRTDTMVRTDNELGVSGTHYFSMVRNRPAEDIYNWMVSAIRSHLKFPAAINGTDPDMPKEIRLTDSMKTEEGWEFTFDDTAKTGGSYAVLLSDGSPADQVQIHYDNAGKYRMTVQSENGQVPGETFTIIHGDQGKNPQKDLLFWSWQSGASRVQTIATGAADPVQRYVRFVSSAESEPGEGNPKPEPEYFPVFEFPVNKEDFNPGWDGNVHTGMGDASLGAVFVLLRDGTEVDRIVLDEYGSTGFLCDQPWQSSADLTETESGSYIHTEISGDPPEEKEHCVVEPVKCSWEGSVTYEVRELRPDGRFTEPDAGMGVRRYTASLEGICENSQTCLDQPENWSSINYTVRWNEETRTGLAGELESLLSYEEETFVNDCYRGRIFLSKSNESEDVFEEEGSSGAQTVSVNSLWKIRLESGGWENHPYIRFLDEGKDMSGTRMYRAVRNTDGTDNEAEALQPGENGCLYVADLPYGTYIVEEVKADDPSFVLESFRQSVGEHGNEYAPQDETKDNRYEWNLRDKKIENVVKVIKVDAETGKQVDLPGTRFYIRYMGNPLLKDPSDAPEYGRLLPNASDINSTEKDYTFQCDENGEIIIPYDLEYGIYQLEEWQVPEGYFVGEDGVNRYTFRVETQPGHMDGEEYIKYYRTASMENQPVKGHITVEKEGEVLSGFLQQVKQGFTVMSPQYALKKLKDAVFGIFAAEDIKAADGNDGPVLYDRHTGEVLSVPMEVFSHSGLNRDGAIYEEGHLLHESGAEVWYRRERDQSAENRYIRVLTVPDSEGTDGAGADGEADAPLYYLHGDGIRTETGCRDGLAWARVTVPVSAVDGNFKPVMPSIRYGRGQDAQILDWFTPLSPDEPVNRIELQADVHLTAKRFEGPEGIWYQIFLVTDQTWLEENGDGILAEQRPFIISFADGYEASLFCLPEKECSVLWLEGVDRTADFAKSDLVEILTTGEDGTAHSGPLPLGDYMVRELSAPEGQVGQEESQLVSLAYEDQNTPLVFRKISAENQAVPVELDLKKVFETGYQTGDFRPGGGALFGIYNGQVLQAEGINLEAGTLLDVVSAGGDGRILASCSLPPGLYYIQEMKTRNGYLVDREPFYFMVGDSAKSEPLCFSRDADGEDADGMTVKAVMDGDGRVRVTVETLYRYPAAVLTVNGTAWMLDKNAAEGNLQITCEKDCSIAELTVEEGQPASLILPDGSYMEVTVTGSTFCCQYNGEVYRYVPEVQYTGYFAEWETEPLKEGETSSVLVLSGAGSLAEAEIRVEKQMETGEETAKSTPVTMQVSLSRGTLKEALRAEKQIPDGELKEPIKLSHGEILKFTAQSGEIFLLEGREDGSIKASVCGAFSGWLNAEEEDCPKALLNGRLLTEGFTLNRSATFARQDSSAKSIQIKINTVDGLTSGVIENRAENIPLEPFIPDWPDSPQIPEVPEIPEVPDEPDIPVKPELQEEPEAPAEPEAPKLPGRVPKTGDSFEGRIWMILLAAAACGMAGCAACLRITRELDRPGKNISSR